MRHEHNSPSPIELELALRVLLALLIGARGERQAAAPCTETVLARAGISDAEIAGVTGGNPTDVQAILDRDRPMSVIDRARGHMTRNAASPPRAASRSLEMVLVRAGRR